MFPEAFFVDASTKKRRPKNFIEEKNFQKMLSWNVGIPQGYSGLAKHGREAPA